MFAARNRGSTPFEMGGRRQRDVDEIDDVSCNELGKTSEGERDPVLRGKALRTIQTASGDRDHFCAEQSICGSHDAARCNACCAQYADAYHGSAVSHDCARSGTLSTRSS